MLSLTRRWIAASAVAVLAATGVSATSQTASAVVVTDANMTLSSSDLVVVPEYTCVAHPIDYAVTPPAGATRWSLDLWLYNSEGTLKGSAMLGSLSGDAPTGTTTIQFCDTSTPAGVYTVKPEYDYRDAGDVFSGVIPGPEFQLTVINNVKTKATIKAKRKGKKVKVSSKVSMSTGSQWAGVVGGKVAVQKKAGRKWKTVKRATTNASGQIAVKVKATRGSVLRVKFAGMGEYTAVGAGVPIPAATSKAVRVR